MSVPADRRQRIVVVGPSHYFYSGVSNYTVSLANAMHAAGHDVSTIRLRKLCPRWIYPLRQHVGGNIGIHALAPGIRDLAEVDYHRPGSWKQAAAHVRATRPDVVVLQWWTGAVAHMYAPILRAARAVGARIVIEMHEVIDPSEASKAVLSRYSRWAFMRLKRSATAFVAHSQKDRELVISEYGLPPEDVHVVPHALYDYFEESDLTTARTTWRTEGLFGILQFGSVRRYKGTLMLLDAFDALPPEVAQRCRLVIAGGLWDDAEEIRDRVSRSFYAEQIFLTGDMVPDKDVPALFHASDLVTLPYLRASQSGVAAIALAQGKAILSTRVGGLEEALVDYEGTRFVEVDAASVCRGILDAFREWEAGKPLSYRPLTRTFDDSARAILATAAPKGGRP